MPLQWYVLLSAGTLRPIVKEVHIHPMGLGASEYECSLGIREGGVSVDVSMSLHVVYTKNTHAQNMCFFNGISRFEEHGPCSMSHKSQTTPSGDWKGSWTRSSSCFCRSSRRPAFGRFPQLGIPLNSIIHIIGTPIKGPLFEEPAFDRN